jgi:hypothetical protein
VESFDNDSFLSILSFPGDVNPFTGRVLGKDLVLGVKRLPEYGEYKITVKIGDSYDEGKANYIPLDGGKEEVSANLLASFEWAKKNGFNVSFTKGAKKFLE